MFERFTDRARRVVVLAQDEARALNHDHIGTEHILLGLVHEGEGVAPRVLDSFGVALGDVRQQVKEIIGQGQQSPSGHLPFTPQAKKVVELSLREALLLGHNYIGTEHLLLALIREEQGVAAQVLTRMGIDLARARRQVLGVLAGGVSERLVTAVPGIVWRTPRAVDDKRARVHRVAALGQWRYEVITPGARPVTVTGLCPTWQGAMQTAESILRVARA